MIALYFVPSVDFTCFSDIYLFNHFLLLFCLIDKPIMDETAQNKKSAGDEGQRAKLVCRATGAPNITFSWSREGVTLSASDKYEVTLSQIDLVVWESSLDIKDLRSRDYGQYDCIARNEMGFNKTSVILTGTSRPDPPLSLRVANVSHDAVELAWKAGFDGGLPQAYRIRYRQVRVLRLFFYSFHRSE